ncbi:MAG: acyl-CoA dehydrogenase [Chloroflexi bacterium]|nr:MAG: acyl-CoA dehydrogenase [Chloroflexota bacterium]
MKIELFNQPPPRLGNQFYEDRVLRSYLKRVLPPNVQKQIDDPLAEMGEMAGGDLYQFQLDDRLNEPMLTNWDAWGNRIDQIEVTPLWKRAEQLAAEFGVVAAAYEGKYGRFDRIYQFALAYLFHPSTDVYTCPLAMTDGAARTLLLSGNRELVDRAVPHLTSRDPQQFWTSGQWMTESTGGSDVGLSQTIARLNRNEEWVLNGRKWFTSATTSQMALTLARPEGNGPGGKGLALFYLELRDENGKLRNIEVMRLKDKLGTRKVPTAELMLHGVTAIPVMGLDNGVRNIVPMLHLTRTWNAVSAASFMRRGMALARDFAKRRLAFGDTLDKKPLHVHTLAMMQAETEAAFHLTFFLVELIGKNEAGDISEDEAALLRILTSITKLTTGRQGVLVSSEVLEAFGGAGYVEDSGLPMLLRDAQVLPIWEGTTNVLALDTVRALVKEHSWPIFQSTVTELVQSARDARLVEVGKVVETAVSHSVNWLQQAVQAGQPLLESGARQLALTMGRALSLALLVRHAQWSMDVEKDGRSRAAAVQFSQNGIEQIAPIDLKADAALANDTPL